MKRTIMLAAAVVSVTTMMLSGCKSKKQVNTDLASIHTTAAAETLSPGIPETTAAASTADHSKETSAAKGISTAMETYKSDKISIQYPIVSGMTDSIKQDQVNQLLKDNAISYLSLQGVDESEDQFSITCKVVSIDRKRIVATYTGTYSKADAAYPVSLFYTNTVDLEQVKNLGLNHFTDGYTMAGYVVSNDCEFYNVSSQLKEELLKYRASQTIEDFTALLNSADFSAMKSGREAAFPQSFSFTDKGVLYFSIPVPHALGDYAIVKFNLDGK